MAIATANGVELSYHLHIPEAGPDAIASTRELSPVVLVNGLADTKETWAAQLPALLNAGFSVLTYDNRGIGASSRPPGKYTAEIMAADLKALVTAIHLPSPFHLVGVSMGGMIVQAYALANPSDILSLTLACTYAAPGPFCSRMFNMWADFAQRMDVTAVMQDVALWGFTHQFFRPEQKASLDEFDAAITDLDLTTDQYLSQLNIIQNFDSTESVERLAVHKVLVVAGEEDILIPTSLSRELHRMIPTSQWATVTGGHCCLWEFPDSFNRTLVQFLQATQPKLA